jgi:DNA-binding GntR family transcriptional regulator
MVNFRVSVPAAPLRQQVTERLRTAITECHFKAGGRLIERELCELLGVSRGSVREALRQLEAEGLIHLIPNVGPVVATVTVEDARQIYEIRRVLEGLASALFAERATDNEVVRLEKSVTKMEKAHHRRKDSAMFKAKTQFYDVLASGCGNPLLATQMVQLRARVSQFREMIYTRDNRIFESLQEVLPIMKAIKERNPEAAREAGSARIEKASKIALGMRVSEENRSSKISSEAA